MMGRFDRARRRYLEKTLRDGEGGGVAKGGGEIVGVAMTMSELRVVCVVD